MSRRRKHSYSFWHWVASLDDPNKLLNRVLIGTAWFVVAFIAANSLLQLVTYIISGELGYTPKFGYSEVGMNPDIHLWTRFKVMEVEFLPMLCCLLLGTALYFLRNKWYGKGQFFRTWFIICLVNIFSAQFLFAPLGVINPNPYYVLYRSVAIFFMWLRLPAILSIALPVISLVISLLAGFLLSKEVVKFSPSSNAANERRGKQAAIILFYFTPVVLGLLPLLLLAKGWSAARFGFILLSLLLMGLGMLLRNVSRSYPIKFHHISVSRKFPVKEFAMFGLVWLLVFIFLR